VHRANRNKAWLAGEEGCGGSEGSLAGWLAGGVGEECAPPPPASPPLSPQSVSVFALCCVCVCVSVSPAVVSRVRCSSAVPVRRHHQQQDPATPEGEGRGGGGGGGVWGRQAGRQAGNTQYFGRLQAQQGLPDSPTVND